MSRFAQHFRVFYMEEPLYDTKEVFLEITLTNENVWTLIPHLTEDMSAETKTNVQEQMLKQLFQQFDIKKYIAWYYTPMALMISNTFERPLLTIYDCMDELSAFKNAPPELKEMESMLMRQADLVFTGGQSLYEAKKDLHPNIHAFPSSIDKAHFNKAKDAGEDPVDQAFIPHPRIGFFGVIDERMNIDLLKDLAEARPDWHFIIVGPVVKIDPATLPTPLNIHYLGSKVYAELPDYLRGWDVAMLPFALNESTRFISPTKTPEYLAGGKPVVSTAIRDVIHPYGDKGLVYIGEDSEDFIEGIEWALAITHNEVWLTAVDAYLEGMSWDKTWDKMMFQINTAIENKLSDVSIKKEDAYV